MAADAKKSDSKAAAFTLTDPPDNPEDRATDPAPADDAGQPDSMTPCPVPAEETDIMTSDTTPAAPRQPGVSAIVQRPVYNRPGHPPILPGELITICPTTAREWLVAGIIRLAPGVYLPVEPRATSGQFPVWAASGNPPPVSQE